MTQERNFRAWYIELSELSPEAPATEKRARGFAFEKVLKGLLASEGLEPRSSYKSAGEQIDGSLYLDGSFLLMEAKWHAMPVPASTLYQFKGKVDGKLVGTIGIFISMSGYSEDAVDALIAGKSLNLILFTKEDMDAAIIQQLGFKKILKEKLRKAAEEGLAFFPTVAEQVKTSPSEPVLIERVHYDRVTGTLLSSAEQPPTTPDLVIVCEGDFDRELLANLVQRILKNASTTKRIQLISALGKVSVPRVANSILLARPDVKVLAVVDGDGDIQGSELMLRTIIESDNWTPIIINPAIESWLGSTVEEMTRQRRRGGLVEHYAKAIEAIDLQGLRSTDPAFETLYQEVSSL